MLSIYDSLIDLNSNLLTYFQRSGCCIKDVKVIRALWCVRSVTAWCLQPYTCPALLPSTPVPIWVPSSIAGLLALILSMVCCVACIATSYWCRKYKKLKVSKTVLKSKYCKIIMTSHEWQETAAIISIGSMTSQLEQFSYQRWGYCISIERSLAAVTVRCCHSDVQADAWCNAHYMHTIRPHKINLN